MCAAEARANRAPHGYQNYSFSLSLDTAQKSYYFGSKNPYVSAVFATALLGLASVRFPATAANHWQLVGVMSWV